MPKGVGYGRRLGYDRKKRSVGKKQKMRKVGFGRAKSTR